MRNIAGLISAIAILAVGVGVAAAVFLGLPQLEAYIRMESVRTCGQVSKFTQEVEDTGVRAEYPVQEVYQECLSTLNISN